MLRPAVLADAEAIARVHWRSWRETYPGLVPEKVLAPSALDRRVVQWRGRLSEQVPGELVRVGEIGGEIVGWALGGPARAGRGPQPIDAAGEDGAPAPPAGWELWGLYVLGSAHGSGVGQALLDAVVPPGACLLWVAEQNPRARAFYRRNGFVEDGAREVEEHLGGLVSIRMVRPAARPSAGGGPLRPAARRPE